MSSSASGDEGIKEVEDSGQTAHLDDFQRALETLLKETFPSLDGALKGLERFKLAGFSPMARNSDFENKKGKKTATFRCEEQGCSFRLLLHHPFEEEKSFRFTLGQRKVGKHSDHELRRPGRASKALLEIAEDVKQQAAADGSSGLELQKKTLNLMSEVCGGESAFNEESYNYQRRNLEKKELALRGKDIDMTFGMMMKQGEDLVHLDPQSCSPDLLAVLGICLKVQRENPDSYINVGFDKHLSYLFFALPEQRRKGSLYGDLRALDDKHSISQNGYHLASCTVQGNEKLEIVGVALFDSSNGANWKFFVEDCEKSFATTSDGPRRSWKVGLADGDGVIHSAVKAVDPDVEIWNCWKHHDKSITTHHLSKSSEWKPLHEIMFKLLTENKASKVEEWEGKAWDLVGKIQNAKLREKEEEMLREVIGRKLGSLKVFSNKWNSQSPAENTNSIYQKLGVGPSHALSVVVDRLFAYFLREEMRGKEEKGNTTTNLSPLIAPLGKMVSRKAFDMILPQFNDSLNYDVVNGEEEDVWSVIRRGLVDPVPRFVRKIGSSYYCSCNMPVYQGIPCRHILCVMVKLREKVAQEHVNSRWLKNSLQPEVKLKFISPFLDREKVPEKIYGREKDIEEGSEGESGREGVEEDEIFGGENQYDFESFVRQNGGDMGEDSGGENDDVDVVLLSGREGGKMRITPSEKRNEVSNYVYQLLQRIGYGKGSVEVLEDLEQCIRSWEEEHLKKSEGIGLAPSIKTLGRPPEHALKPGNRNARSNSVKSKKVYKCGVCGKEGHTAGSKCPQICLKCPSGVKKHKKDECPDKSDGEKEESEQKKSKKSQKKKKKKKNQGEEEDNDDAGGPKSKKKKAKVGPNGSTESASQGMCIACKMYLLF